MADVERLEGEGSTVVSPAAVDTVTGAETCPVDGSIGGIDEPDERERGLRRCDYGTPELNSTGAWYKDREDLGTSGGGTQATV